MFEKPNLWRATEKSSNIRITNWQESDKVVTSMKDFNPGIKNMRSFLQECNNFISVNK